MKKNTAVTILSNKVVKKKKWYRISAKYKNKTVKGWTLSKYITLTKPVVQKKVKVVALSEADFEKSMTAQGFPESYNRICVPFTRNIRTGSLRHLRRE